RLREADLERVGLLRDLAVRARGERLHAPALELGGVDRSRRAELPVRPLAEPLRPSPDRDPRAPEVAVSLMAEPELLVDRERLARAKLQARVLAGASEDPEALDRRDVRERDLL